MVAAIPKTRQPTINPNHQPLEYGSTPDFQSNNTTIDPAIKALQILLLYSFIYDA